MDSKRDEKRKLLKQKLDALDARLNAQITQLEQEYNVKKAKVKGKKKKQEIHEECDAKKQEILEERVPLENAYMLSSAFHEISVPNFHLIAEYMTNEDKYRLMCACLKEKQYVLMRKFLFVAGIMDVCRPEHALKEKIPVVYESSEYEGNWRMLAAATEAHVRVMDDLATTERSRWELWAEVHHGRVSESLFLQILQEEIDFIQQDRREPTKRVQVQWEGDTAQWYPIAVKILKELVLSDEPVEFATELLMPFTFPIVRQQSDPYGYIQSLKQEEIL